MGMAFKKTGRFIMRSILTLCALLFVALISVQLVLIVGINLVSTGRGTDFIAGKINGAMAESGYQIGFDKLYYDPVRGLTVYDLSVSDEQGVFVTLDRFSLDISFVLAPIRTLDLYARGGTLSIARLPLTKEGSEETQEGLKPFETPDIYFKTITLSKLSFDHIRVAEDVAGKAYDFTPVLQGSVSLKDTVDLGLSLRPGFPDLAPGLAAPETIRFNGSLTPRTLAFSLQDFSAQASDYALDVTGTGILSGDGAIDINAKARHDDLSTLTQDMFGEASAQIDVTGPLAGPALDISALIIPKSLKERGLSDIKVSLKTADISAGMKGLARIDTAFQNEPVSLESALSYEAPHLTLADIKGSAPDISLTGGGQLSLETSLFDGALSLSAQNLARYSELAGKSIAGTLEAKAALKPSESGMQSADISLSINKGAFDAITVKSLSAQAQFSSLETPWPQSAKLQAAALQLAPDVTLDTVNAAINAAGQEETYKLTLKGSGRAPVAVSFDGSATLSGLTQTIPSARDIALTVKQGESSVRLGGDFTPQALDLTLSAKDFRGRDLPAALPQGLENLRIDLDGTMTGAPSKPISTISATMRGIGAGAYQNASVSLNADHDGQTVSARLTGKGTGIRTLDGTASFPMALSLVPFSFVLDQGAALTGTLAADIDLAGVAPLFLPPTQSLAGALTANGTIAGSIAAPVPNAAIRLSGVNFNDRQNGIVVAELQASAKLSKNTLTLNSLSATDGKQGTLDGNGTMSLAGGGTNVAMRLRDFNAPQGNLANGIVSADLSLKGSQRGMHLSGNADIAELKVLIPETFSSRIPQLNIVEDKADTGPGFLDLLTFDIAIDANNQVFVRGWGLDAEFGGDIAITGAASDPQFNGALSARRGRYEEFGKRFTLARADLRFQGNVPPSPYLDIEATTPAGDVTGSILLTGPVTDPSIKFASTPALPEDEVLSRILFGKESSRISPFQAVQLAQTIRRFSGEGGDGSLDPLGKIRSATGLDDISIDTDADGAASVGAGKYLSDNVYLEVSKGKAEDSGAATIQIEVTPSINIESQIGQDAQGGGGVFWKHDY